MIKRWSQTNHDKHVKTKKIFKLILWHRRRFKIANLKFCETANILFATPLTHISSKKYKNLVRYSGVKGKNELIVT